MDPTFKVDNFIKITVKSGNFFDIGCTRGEVFDIGCRRGEGGGGQGSTSFVGRKLIRLLGLFSPLFLVVTEYS